MLREKIKEINVSSCNKWKVSSKMPLIKILTLSAYAPLWKMARNNVNNSSTNKDVYQFQVACLSCINLKQKQSLKEKIDNCLSTKSDGKQQHIIVKILNTTVTMPLLWSCSMITGCQSFSRIWVLLSFDLLKTMCVLIICVFKEKQSCCYHTEDFKILYLISSQ